MQVFGISTSSVDNVVDKRLLTRQKARIGGHFLNLPVPRAEFKFLKNQTLGDGADSCWNFL